MREAFTKRFAATLVAAVAVTASVVGFGQSTRGTDSARSRPLAGFGVAAALTLDAVVQPARLMAGVDGPSDPRPHRRSWPIATGLLVASVLLGAAAAVRAVHDHDLLPALLVRTGQSAPRGPPAPLGITAR